MSRRRLEQGASGASSFSLRTLSTVAAAPAPAPSRPMSAAAANTPMLNFKFDALGPRPVSGSPPKALEAPKLPVNFFAKSSQPVAGQQGDVLRLTAVIDDLNSRLRKANETKTQLEGQVQRINSALVQERSSSAARVQALKAEMMVVTETESKLRAELASRPSVKEVDTNRFMSSVRTALEQEETNARVADGEARVAQLSKRAEALAAEVKLLEERKGSELAAASAVSAMSAAEVEDLVTQAAQVQAKIASLDEQRAGLEDDVARYSAMRDAHREEMKQAELALFKANEATAMAVADSVAAKEQVQATRDEHGKKVAEVAALSAKLEEMTTIHAAPSFKVSGAAAPTRLNDIIASPAAAVEAMAAGNLGLAYHFHHDAPIGFANISSSHASTESPTDAMVHAVVADLQSVFNFAAEEHARIGKMKIPAVAVA